MPIDTFQMAKKKQFEVECPYCQSVNDFTEDNWRDELIDTSGSSEIECDSCGQVMKITTEAVYTLTAEKNEEE